MGQFPHGTGVPLGLLLIAAVLLMPTSLAAAPANGHPAAGAPPEPRRSSSIHPIFRERLANGILISTVTYNSSVDSFPLSYSEVLPAGFVSTDHYPLLVELHGISVTASTPLPGGYPTPLDNLTMNDTSAMDFILIVPNTRTGDGFYIDSTYTGPQAQDILDAIATEKALRMIGSVYLYGFSMGSMGSLSIGLQHPGEFAGLGSIATFSDIYQVYAYQASHNAIPLNDALTNLTGGLLPNESAYAAQIFNELAELRFHPELTKGIRMYLTSGGKDSLAADNPALWPYLQGNNSVLQTTCLVATEIAEPANCTLPLAALNAADPTNYSYRFVYEAQGVHAYEQVNVTDMLKFFLGDVPSGSFVGDFPTPTVSSPALPQVILVTVPFACGTVSWVGVPFPNGYTLTGPTGEYPVGANACPGYEFSHFVGRGGVAYDPATGNATVSGSGALVAVFSPMNSTTNPALRYFVTVSTTAGCPTASLNGSAVPSGTAVALPAGEYVAEAGPCPGAVFSMWSASSGVQVWAPRDPETGLTLTANGTLVAMYQLETQADSVTIIVSPSSCAPVYLNGTAVANGSVTVLLPGSYSLVAPACPGYQFAAWSLAGGLSGGGGDAATTVSVTGPGSATAVYAAGEASSFRVVVSVNPSSCGSVVGIEGVLYASGTIATLPPGAYTLTAGGCPSYTFGSWVSTGGVIVSVGSIMVSGNGTLSATYGPSGTSHGGGNQSTTSPSSTFLPSWAVPYLWIAVGVAIGAVVGLLVARRGRTVRSGSNDDPAPYDPNEPPDFP